MIISESTFETSCKKLSFEDEKWELSTSRDKGTAILKRYRFDISKFPYPIAEVYSYLPETELEFDQTGGVVGAIQNAVICFETICRFCVWEMVMEYARLDVKDSKLQETLDEFIFLAKGSVSPGTWVVLWRQLSDFLRHHHQKLFMPEVPFAFFDRTRNKLSSVAREAIIPFVKVRNRYLAHPNTRRSPGSHAESYMDMREK